MRAAAAAVEDDDGQGAGPHAAVARLHTAAEVAQDRQVDDGLAETWLEVVRWGLAWGL